MDALNDQVITTHDASDPPRTKVEKAVAWQRFDAVRQWVRQWSNSNIRIPSQHAPLRILELKDHQQI
jgi:hypothetical protein